MTMPRSLATIGADTTLTSCSIGRRKPAIAADVSALVFICATAPSYEICTLLMPASVSWPANEPSFSASAMNGFSRGASSAVIEGKFTALEIAPRNR